jgi:UDP-N-acetylglucosamine 2-epimerase (non-hydrolysing)
MRRKLAPYRPAMGTIAYVVGARPNFVKMAPVERALRRRLPSWRHVRIDTGQHYDREMSGIFEDELGIPAAQYRLGVGSGTHGAQTGRALERIEQALVRERPELLLVPGDVNSTLAGALAAAKLGVPVGHIEAGLRSFDRSMPEEMNRVLVDQLADWCYIHSAEAVDNLLREGVAEERIVFTGNTMIDTLVRMTPHVERSRVLTDLGLEHGRYLLVTLHRPALVDGPLLADVVQRLDRLAHVLPVVFPLHPRTRVRLRALPQSGRVQFVDPLGYIDFLALETHARAVLTDSGGVQEETTFLGVPCFTLRDSTERPVTLSEGTNRLLGLDPEAIDRLPELIATAQRPLRPPRGWDGQAAERLADSVAEALAPEVPALVGAGVHG